MLTRILHNSDQLQSFFHELDIDLFRPQRQHMLNMADALLVCEDTKTLAALQRQFVQAPDASNMADFLRISPWGAHDVRDALRQYQVNRLLAEAKEGDAEQVVYINIDDSLGEKDKATRHIQVVEWHHDHSESTKNRQRYKNAFCYPLVLPKLGLKERPIYSLFLFFEITIYLSFGYQRMFFRQPARAAIRVSSRVGAFCESQICWSLSSSSSRSSVRSYGVIRL